MVVIVVAMTLSPESTTSPAAAATATLTGVQATAVCLAMFLEGISSSSINVQIAAVRTDLALSDGQVQWVATAFLVAYAGLLVPAGRWVDRWDRRRIFLLGLGLFAAGSLACAIAPVAELLILGRGTQGVGAALSAPAALALVTAGRPAGAERNRMVARYGALGAVGFSTGLVLPALVVTHLGWRTSFAALVPCALAVAALVWRVPAGSARSRPATSPTIPWWPVPRGVVVGAVALFGAFAGVLSSILVLTLALQDWQGLDPFTVGLLVLPQPLCFAMLSRWGARWVDRSGSRWPLLTGLVLVSTAIAGVAVGWSGPAGGTGLVPLVLAAMAIVGAGLAMLYPAASIAAVDAVPEGQRGTASGILTTAQNLGGTAGVAVVTSLGLLPAAGAIAALGPSLLAPALVGLATVVAVIGLQVGPRRSCRRAAAGRVSTVRSRVSDRE